MNKNDKTSFIYSKECSLLAMDSTPYIGVYSDNYSFVIILLLFKQVTTLYDKHFSMK